MNSKEVLAYESTSKTWRVVSQMNTIRMRTGATTWKNTVVVAGGFPYKDRVEQYDPNTNIWTSMPNLLIGRYFLALVNLNGTLYAIGGSVKGESTDNVEMFVETSNVWKETESLNTGRKGLTAAVLEVGLSELYFFL